MRSLSLSTALSITALGACGPTGAAGSPGHADAASGSLAQLTAHDPELPVTTRLNEVCDYENLPRSDVELSAELANARWQQFEQVGDYYVAGLTRGSEPICRETSAGLSCGPTDNVLFVMLSNDERRFGIRSEVYQVQLTLTAHNASCRIVGE